MITLEKHKNAALSITEEFIERIDSIYGLYLDSTTGFQENVRRLKEAKEVAAGLGDVVNFADDAGFAISSGSPNSRKSIILHNTTIGEFRKRNSHRGSNYRLLAQYFVVLIFHLWENEYRLRIAKALGKDSADTLKLPIFGDLRLLRNEILKHKGVVKNDTKARLTVLSGIAAERTVSFSADDIYEILVAVKKAIDVLISAEIGVNPRYGRVRRLSK